MNTKMDEDYVRCLGIENVKRGYRNMLLNPVPKGEMRNDRYINAATFTITCISTDILYFTSFAK